MLLNATYALISLPASHTALDHDISFDKIITVSRSILT